MDSRTNKRLADAMRNLTSDAATEIGLKTLETNQRPNSHRVAAHSSIKKWLTDKDKLWNAASEGNLKQFKLLLDSGIIKDINEYNENEGITLLHAVVGGDVYYCEGEFAQIAAILLNQGARLDLPAILTQAGKEPQKIDVGESPFEAARKYSYANTGHSYAFDGFRVMPVFQKHLNITPPKKSCYDNITYAATCARIVFWEAYGNQQKAKAAIDELRVPSYKF